MKKFIIITVCFGLIANSIFGQEAQTSVSFYTGGMSVNIPIYTIQDPDFTLPVSMIYNANGYMPEQLSGLIGMGWSLNAGGYIARKVFEDADDEGNGANNSTLSKLKAGNSVTFSPDIFYFSVNGTSGSFFLTNNGDVKIISNDVVSVDLSKLKHQYIDYNTAPPGEDSYIKIVDKNGYSYIFGGKGQHIIKRRFTDYRKGGSADLWYMTEIIAPNGRRMIFEYYDDMQSWSKSNYSVSNIVINQPCNCQEPTLYDTICFPSNNPANTLIETGTRIEDAFLKNIRIDDIGFSMKFNTVFSDNEHYLNKDELKLWRIGREYGSVMFIRLNSIDLKIGDNTQTFTFHRESIECNKNKSAFLKGVTTFTGTKYSFDYNTNSECLRVDSTFLDNPICYNPICDPPSKKNQKVCYNPKSYACLNNSCNCSDKEKIKECITYSCYKYWYHWYLRDNYGYFKSNPYYGILTKVTLPTGGTQHYTYEKHKYSKMKLFAMNETWVPEIIFEDNPRQDLYNNIRIKKIETKDENNNLVETKEYIYTENDDNYTYVSSMQHAPSNYDYTETPPIDTENMNIVNSNVSSGTLNCDFAIKTDNAAKPYYVFDRATLTNPEPLAVTYSRVKERITLSSGKTFENIYKFQSYSDMPDVFLSLYNPTTGKQHPYETQNQSRYEDRKKSVLKMLYGFSSLSERRGLLKERIEYEGSSLPLRKTKFDYQELFPDNDGKGNYVVEYLDSYSSNFKMYIGSSNPTKITTTEYFNGSEITTSTELIYDSKNRLSEKITDEIDGRKYFTKYRYADDIVPNLQPVLSGFAGGFQKIQNQGWLGRVVETVSGYKENGTTFYTSGTISLFNKKVQTINGQIPDLQQPPNQPQTYPHHHWLSNASPYIPVHPTQVLYNQQHYVTLSQERSLVLPTPSTTYTFMNENGGNIVYDERYKVFVDYEYNNKLRLKKVKPANALETTYLWDNKNLYPTSETTGKFTTTYTYIPMVGKETETDSRGVKTIYKYDKHGRLIKVSREINGTVETLQEYEYNYQK